MFKLNINESTYFEGFNRKCRVHFIHLDMVELFPLAVKVLLTQRWKHGAVGVT